MTGMDLAKGQDDCVVWSCQHLIKNGQSLPKGESAETMAEFVEHYRVRLHQIKHRKGKGVLVLEIEELAKKWPCPGNPAQEIPLLPKKSRKRQMTLLRPRKR